MGLVKSQVKAEITGEDVSGSAALQKFSNSIDKTAEQAQSATAKTSGAFTNFASNSANAFGSIATGIENVAKRVALLAVGSGGLGTVFLKSAADLQQTSKSFEVLIGNADTANKLFAQIKRFADATPFEFPELAKSAQTLLGYGISVNDVFKRLKMLGDISAVTGADLGSLAVVFGQVTGAGRLMGQDALQLVNNHIPITTILTKKLGISAKELRDRIEAGTISTQIFTEALQGITEKGGIAFEGTDQLAKTFNGRMSTLKDTVMEFGRNLIGVKVDPELGFTVQPNGIFDRLSKALPDITASLTKLTPKMTGFVTVILNNGKTVVAVISAIAAAYVGAKIAAIGFSIAASINPAGLIAAGVVALIAALTFLQIRFDIFGKAIRFLHPIIRLFSDALKDMWTQFSRLGKLIGESLAPMFGFLADHMTAVKVIGAILLTLVLLPLISTAAILYASLRALGFAADFISDHFQGLKQVLGFVFAPFIEVMKVVVEWLDKIRDHVDGVKAAFNNAKDAVGNFVDVARSKLSDMKDRIVGVYQDIVSTAKDKGGSFYDTTKDKLIGAFTAVSEFLKPWRDNFVGTLQNTLDKAKNALINYDLDTLDRWSQNLSNLSDRVKKWGTDNYNNTKGALKNALKAFSDWGTETYNSMKIGLGNSIQAIKDWVPETYNNIKVGLANGIQAILDWGKNVYTNTKTSLGNAITAIHDWGIDVYNTTKASIENFFSALVNFFTSLPARISALATQAGQQTGDDTASGVKSVFQDKEKMKKVGDAIIGGLLLVVASLLISLVDIGTQVAQGIINGMNSIGDKFDSVGRQMVSGIVNGIGSAIGDLSNAASRMVDTVKNFFSDTYHILFDAGKWLVWGFKDGIMSVINDIKDTAGNIGDAVKNKVKSVLGIRSPSTVFAGYGENVVQGMVNGINNNMGKVQDAASNLSLGLQAPSVNIAGSPGIASRSMADTGDSTSFNRQQPNINITIQAQAFAGSQQDARKFATMLMKAYQDAQTAKGMA